MHTRGASEKGFRALMKRVTPHVHYMPLWCMLQTAHAYIAAADRVVYRAVAHALIEGFRQTSGWRISLGNIYQREPKLQVTLCYCEDNEFIQLLHTSSNVHTHFFFFKCTKRTCVLVYYGMYGSENISVCWIVWSPGMQQPFDVLQRNALYVPFIFKFSIF